MKSKRIFRLLYGFYGACAVVILRTTYVVTESFSFVPPDQKAQPPSPPHVPPVFPLIVEHLLKNMVYF